MVLFYLSASHTSFTPLPAYRTLSMAGWVALKCGRKETEAAGAEINTVLLHMGWIVQPHQALPGAPPPTKPMERCSWPPGASAAEAERRVDVQEVGNRVESIPAPGSCLADR